MRWIKLLRDVKAESGRAMLMLAAVGFALIAVTTMLAAYGIVTREVNRNYMSTNPASATIDVGEVSQEMLTAAKAFPGVADAEARSVVAARVKVGGEWMRMLLFVVDDFATTRMNLFAPYSGAEAPADGAMLVEKVAAPLIGAVEGETITIKTPHGPETAVRVDGQVATKAGTPVARAAPTEAVRSSVMSAWTGATFSSPSWARAAAVRPG